MATRKEILNDIRKSAGNALSKAELGRYLNVGKDSVNVFCKDLPSYKVDGHRTVYLAIDVAKKLDCSARFEEVKGA